LSIKYLDAFQKTDVQKTKTIQPPPSRKGLGGNMVKKIWKDFNDDWEI
jgi:hypothetical protein